MGEPTVEHRARTTRRSRTAPPLALPVAVLIHVLGALALNLLIGSQVWTWSTPALHTVISTIDVLLALVVVALCGAALLADRAAARSGAARHRSRSVATWALAAALLVPEAYALLWYPGIGVHVLRDLGPTVTAAAVFLAVVALVTGALATRGAAGRTRAALAVAAVASPAALMAPMTGLVASSAVAYTVAQIAGVVLAVVGLVAAAVAVRHGAALIAGGAQGRADGDGLADGDGRGDAVATDGTGRRFLRHLATPLALAALLLAAPALGAGADGALAVVALVLAFVLALAGIVGAVLQVRAERRGSRVRAAAGVAAFTVPFAVILVPVAVALAAVFGDEDGWAVLGALFVSVPLATVVALAGLVAAIVAASTRQYPSVAAGACVLCTALVPLVLVLFVPLQESGLALGVVVVAGLLLLAALVAGVAAVASRRVLPTGGTGAAEGTAGTGGPGAPERPAEHAPAPDPPHNPYL